MPDPYRNQNNFFLITPKDQNIKHALTDYLGTDLHLENILLTTKPIPKIKIRQTIVVC